MKDLTQRDVRATQPSRKKVLANHLAPNTAMACITFRDTETGGSAFLVSKRVLVTAAHTLTGENFDQMRVLLALTGRSATNPKPTFIEMTPKTHKIFPGYKPNPATGDHDFENDLACIVLDDEADAEIDRYELSSLTPVFRDLLVNGTGDSRARVLGYPQTQFPYLMESEGQFTGTFADDTVRFTHPVELGNSGGPIFASVNGGRRHVAFGIVVRGNELDPPKGPHGGLTFDQEKIAFIRSVIKEHG